MNNIFITLPEDTVTLNGQTYYSAVAVAAHLKVSVSTIYNWIEAGRLSAIHQPGMIRPKFLVPQADLIRFIQGQ
jgi:excisionase family DNA binding protein